MKTPTSKAENYALYESGFYGNHLKFWKHVHDLLGDLKEGRWSADKPYVFRLSKIPGNRPPKYCTPMFGMEDARELMYKWADLGISRDLIKPNEVGPDHCIVLQGELRRSPNYLDLRYTLAKCIMSSAWAQDERHLSGFNVKRLLLDVMDDASYENLQHLWDTFTDDETIIEFSCYSKPVGVLGHNTVIWEVRNY